MKVLRFAGGDSPGAATHRNRGGLVWLVGWLLLFASFIGRADPPLSTDNPTAFFNTVAGRLLQSELGLELTHIQIYPTNQYTPSVHRLLQLTANIYDCTTNRTVVSGTSYPTVFQPLFQRLTNDTIVIAGYRELEGNHHNFVYGPPIPVDLNDPQSRSLLPATPSDAFMVFGIPLVIGAKKGFPNFNEFAMQTYVYVGRLLEFRRPAGQDPNTSPVNETNQMYVLNITNTFGLEAWNAYSAAYSNQLMLVATVDMTAWIQATNQANSGYILFSNRVTQMAVTNVLAWPGYNSANPNVRAMNFILPYRAPNNGLIWTNGTYLNSGLDLIARSHVFERGQDLYVPRWWLNLSQRVRFTLYDVAACRIVDYVNLSDSAASLDIMAKLMEGSAFPLGSSTPNGDPTDINNGGNLWITNRLQSSTSTKTPTYGVMNQIMAGLEGVNDWTKFTLDPSYGDKFAAVDGFRKNLMNLTPLYPQDAGKTFYKSNIFYAPLIPYRPLFLDVVWQANDPLVHYTVSDLGGTNSVAFNVGNGLGDLGAINAAYQPWGRSKGGGYPSPRGMGSYEIGAKDPPVTSSDAWDFPTNQGIGLGWLGRVHRGTPWQTVYLKSTNVDFISWMQWTGNWLVRPMWNGIGFLVYDAFYTMPTNDWHLPSLLGPLFGANDPRTLLSINRAGADAWAAALDGLLVVTNAISSPPGPIVMSSNSPQAAIIAAAIEANRLNQRGQVFHSPADIMATPELSVASPWLGGPAAGLTDEIIEMIPAQLLPLLRPDSVGAITRTAGSFQVQFSGFDGYAYAVEVSSNLVDWVAVSTNYPSGGAFSFQETASSGAARRFYRSVLR